MADRLIAIADIYAAPGVLAFTKGSIVPASAADNLNARDKVQGEKSKAAKSAVEDLKLPLP